MDAAQTLYANYNKALEAARAAEAKSMATATLNKRWKAVFAAEDALKLAMGGWAA